VILEPEGIHVQRRTDIENVRIGALFQMWYAVFRTATWKNNPMMHDPAETTAKPQVRVVATRTEIC